MRKELLASAPILMCLVSMALAGEANADDVTMVRANPDTDVTVTPVKPGEAWDGRFFEGSCKGSSETWVYGLPNSSEPGKLWSEGGGDFEQLQGDVSTQGTDPLANEELAKEALRRKCFPASELTS